MSQHSRFALLRQPGIRFLHFFSNIERILVSSVLHVVCKMYDNLSYSVDLTGLLALRFYAAPLSSVRLVEVEFVISMLAIYARSDFFHFSLFSVYFGQISYSPSGMGLFVRPALL